MKRTILGIVADGAARVVGPAAGDVRVKAAEGRGTKHGKKSQETPWNNGVTAGHAIIPRGMEAFSADHQQALDSSGNNGIVGDDPIFFAENVVVPAGNRGRTQLVIDYRANHAAALLVLMRLRRPAAEELAVAAVAGLVRAFETVGTVNSSERLEQIEGRLAAIEAPLGQLVQWLEEQRARERKRNPGPRLQPPRVGAAPRIDPAALAAFLATRPAGEQIAAAELFQQYLRWCRDSGAEPVTLTMFGRQIMASGEYRRTETKGGRIYTRILFS